MEMFSTYKVSGLPANADHGMFLEGRTQLFHSVGRAALRTGQALADLVALNKSQRKATTAEARETAITAAMKGAKGTAEKGFRDILLSASAIQQDAMPTPKYPDPRPERTARANETQNQSKFCVAALTDAMDGELRIESSGLTVDAVFRRLGVEGLGGAVQIRPGALLLPGGKDDWAEAAPEAPEAHSQQRAMSAMAGTLVAVKLPRAKISVAGADGKATADFSVSVDDLVPAVAAVHKEQAPPEPALAEEKDATLTLPKYNFDELQGPFLRASAEVLQYALAWFFGANPLRARNAQVLMLSEKGKLPYKFQVRVRNETYKKGELVLVPYAQQALVSQESADALGTFTAKETEKVLDESLCAVAEISVHAALDGRSAEAKRAKRDGSQPTVEQT